MGYLYLVYLLAQEEQTFWLPLTVCHTGGVVAEPTFQQNSQRNNCCQTGWIVADDTIACRVSGTLYSITVVSGVQHFTGIYTSSVLHLQNTMINFIQNTLVDIGQDCKLHTLSQLSLSLSPFCWSPH